MTRIVSYVLLLTAISITAAGGVFHGRLSHRWGTRNDVSRAVSRLESFPSSVGHWKVRDVYSLPKSATDQLQCNGYMNRQYVHDETGEIVNVAVLLGPSGPISVHTPEVCYSSREFKQLAKRKAVTVRDIANDETQFWSLMFESTTLEKQLMSVCYGWSMDGDWQANESPRFTYAGKPFLFKIQLAAMLPTDSAVTETDPCQKFLQDFVPALKRNLFAADVTSGKSS